MKKVFGLLLAIALLPMAIKAHVVLPSLKTIIEVSEQGGWVETVARSPEGKMLKVKYKINSFGKIDTFEGVYYYSEGFYSAQWIRAFLSEDKFGYYITVYGTKYYL